MGYKETPFCSLFLLFSCAGWVSEHNPNYSGSMSIPSAAKEQRIRRALAREGQRLCIPRSEAVWQSLGIHVVEDNSNTVIAWQCDLDQLASELGVD